MCSLDFPAHLGSSVGASLPESLPSAFVGDVVRSRGRVRFNQTAGGYIVPDIISRSLWPHSGVLSMKNVSYPILHTRR